MKIQPISSIGSDCRRFVHNNQNHGNYQYKNNAVNFKGNHTLKVLGICGAAVLTGGLAAPLLTGAIAGTAVTLGTISIIKHNKNNN